jgi:hypothetical protein
VILLHSSVVDPLLFVLISSVLWFEWLGDCVGVANVGGCVVGCVELFFDTSSCL